MSRWRWPVHAWVALRRGRAVRRGRSVLIVGRCRLSARLLLALTWGMLLKLAWHLLAAPWDRECGRRAGERRHWLWTRVWRRARAARSAT